ncbi:hypothetical protein ONZ51_g13016 [Trametes cubensis]|uniref:Uncharacterized protein n=1 Tax=Trametes cubensis TaxID=1111947 RepID=A0AAD7TH97_9APHY|nr:hypothetical protein ONZ51_g13016 [Trametes cubensis]
MTSSFLAVPDTTMKACPDTLTTNLEEKPVPEKRDADYEDDAYVSISTLANSAPPGWIMHVHPRGFIYWSNPRCKAIVDADLRIPAFLEKANQFCAHCAELDLDEDMEAHVVGGMEASFCLFVNHRQCVAGYELTNVKTRHVKDMTTNGLLRARRLYWNFIAYHPSHKPNSPHGFEEAIDALRSYYHEYLVYGGKCIAPFSKAECEELLNVLHRAKDEANSGQPATAALLGWLLKDVYSFRSADRYGQVTREEQKTYRQLLSRPPSFTPKQSPATRLFLLFLVNIPFFGIPQTYLAYVKNASEFRGHLQGLKQNWETYTLQLVKEYSDFILIATVLLSATVGLLTINDIGETCRVAAILSAFAALGSVTVGVFFVWRHQRNAHMPASFTYLHNARYSALGLSGHALLLSLPPVLLVWSLIAFTVAALAYALQDISQASTWIIFGLFVMMLLAVMAGVYTFSTIWQWQSNEGWWAGLFHWRRNKGRAESSSV